LLGMVNWSYHNISWWKCVECQNLISLTIKGRAYRLTAVTYRSIQNEHVLSVYCLSGVRFKGRQLK
jgi:hypothetical protein